VVRFHEKAGPSQVKGIRSQSAIGLLMEAHYLDDAGGGSHVRQRIGENVADLNSEI